MDNSLFFINIVLHFVKQQNADFFVIAAKNIFAIKTFLFEVESDHFQIINENVKFLNR